MWRSRDSDTFLYAAFVVLLCGREALTKLVKGLGIGPLPFSCRSFQVSVFAKVHLDGRLLTFTPPLQKLSARQLSCVL